MILTELTLVAAMFTSAPSNALTTSAVTDALATMAGSITSVYTDANAAPEELRRRRNPFTPPIRSPFTPPPR